MKNEIQVTEKKLKLSAEEFRALFSKPEYKPARTYGYLDEEEEETVNSFLNKCEPFVTIFNQLMDKRSTLVTESLFVKHADAMLYQKAVEGNFEMTPRIRKYLRWRVESSYKGFVTELYAITLLSEIVPNILISINEEADLKEGIDFMVSFLETNMTYRLHITSIEGLKRLIYKEKKVKGRYFGNDQNVVYNDRNDDEKSYQINSFPFFKEEYLLKTLEEMINDKSKGFRNDDPEFINRCTKHGGEWEMYRSNDIFSSYEENIQEIKKTLGKKE